MVDPPAAVPQASKALIYACRNSVWGDIGTTQLRLPESQMVDDEARTLRMRGREPVESTGV
jgi:hypothetical protein